MKRFHCTILFSVFYFYNIFAQNHKSFFIGHSLTDNVPDMVKSLATGHPSVELDWRFQNIPGSSLEYQYSRKQPGNGYSPVPPHIYGFFHPTEGLPAGNFDDLILTESVPRHWGQYGIGRTYIDMDSFYNYYQATNPNQQLFFYEVWHCINSGSPTGCSYDINTSPWRQRLTDDFLMWKSVIDTVNTRHNPTKPVRMIPGGQGLARLTDSIMANKIPGLTSINQLFADDIHLNDVGRYFIACIHFATIFKTSPSGLTNQLYSQWGGAYTPPTAIQAAKFQEIAWQIVTDLWEVTGVNPPQVQAKIAVNTAIGAAPLTVAFDASSSINNSGGALTYSWNFGDGSSGTGVTINHSFLNVGVYNVTLTVTNSTNHTDTTMVSITALSQNSANQCSYLAYEPFSYSQNSALHGHSGGSGFTGNWLVQGDNIDVPGFQIANTNSSLSYNTLQTQGGQASGGRSYLASGRRFNTLSNGPFTDYTLINNQAIGASQGGKVLWVSMLLNKPQNDDDGVSFELHSNDNAWCNLCGGTQRIGFGYYGSPSNVGVQRRWSLNIGDIVYPSSVPLVAGSTTLLVMKLTFNTTGTLAELYINPSAIGDNSPGVAQISQTTPTPYAFKSCGYYGGSTFNKSLIDEIRLAKSYKCATPDPSVSFTNLNDFIWNGSISTQWSDPNNWDNLQLPTSESTVIIPIAVPRYPQVNMNDEIKTLILQSPASLTVMPGFTLKIKFP